MIDVTENQGIVYPFASLGKGINSLDAFDDAEINAGIEALNAVKFTSFVPVGPKGRWSVDDNPRLARLVKKGDSLPMAFQYSCSDDKYVSAALAIGLNKDPEKPGIILEYSRVDIHEDELAKIAVDSLERTFFRRKKYHWNLDKVITKKAGGFPKDGLVTCALVGGLYVPESYLGNLN